MAKKLVLFGAGKIGRSFIGQLFSRSGYEVVFLDIDRRVLEALNTKHSYNVYIADTNPETIVVNNVRGVLSTDLEKVCSEIATTDVLAVSIGKNGLKHIISTLAQGLLKREELYPGKKLDIIIAENMRNADEYLHEELAAVLPKEYPFDDRVGLVETSIGKMVPLIKNDDPNDFLSVHAEAFNTLIVDKEAFKNPVPEVKGMEAKENMKAWVDRKLCIHNFGHAATAYMGYKLHPDRAYMWQVLEDKAVTDFARSAMQQSAKALRQEYPETFTEADLQEHIDDLLRRFTNRNLGDTVFRVGCDLYRKLSSDDRIVTPLMSAYNKNLPYDKIVEVVKAALEFKATGEDGKMFPSDIEFHNELKAQGSQAMLRKVCGFTDEQIEKFGL